MNGRSGPQGPNQYPNHQALNSQVGFYLLPPDQQQGQDKAAKVSVYILKSISLVLRLRRNTD